MYRACKYKQARRHFRATAMHKQNSQSFACNCVMQVQVKMCQRPVIAYVRLAGHSVLDAFQTRDLEFPSIISTESSYKHSKSRVFLYMLLYYI